MSLCPKGCEKAAPSAGYSVCLDPVPESRPRGIRHSSLRFAKEILFPILRKQLVKMQEGFAAR